MIQNPAKVSLHRGQLQLENDDGKYTLPLEDITALILESPQILLTSAVLAECLDNGLAVLTCDKSHMPSGVLLPFQPHSRQSGVARIQSSITEPLKKRLWQRLVQAKIRNQAACLEGQSKNTEAKRLYTLATQVQSGDTGNLEAQAARAYWQPLMGSDFRRGGGCIVNSALNYGYAAIRAFVARSQVAYGLLPTFGLHHDNALNAFNLTDDVMEVFRPFVDKVVVSLKDGGSLPPDSEHLSKEVRQTLANMGNSICTIDSEAHTIANASDKMAAGLVAAIEGRSAPLMPIPEWASPPQKNQNKTHNYKTQN